MYFKIEDLLVEYPSSGRGLTDDLRITHKPSLIVLYYQGKNGVGLNNAKERLLAEIRVLVENYEPIKPS